MRQVPRGHKLVTKEIERKLAKNPVYSNEGKTDEAEVIVKFFSPYSDFTWYVIEAERREDGDWEFFGLVTTSQGKELTYFCLSQLEDAIGGGGLPLVERDCYFGSHTLGEFS